MTGQTQAAAMAMADKAGARLAAYTFAHGCVDFCCVFTVFQLFLVGAGPIAVFFGIVLYDLLAFLLQAPIGALLDRFRRIPAAFIGFALIAGGSVLLPLVTSLQPSATSWLPFSSNWQSLLAVTLVGLGNALFHVEGGIDSLRNSNGRFYRSGLFVSTGVLGLAAGTVLGNLSMPEWFFLLPLLLMAACTLALALAKARPAASDLGAPVPDFMTARRSDRRPVAAAAAATHATSQQTAAQPNRARRAVKDAALLFVIVLFLAVLVRAIGGYLVQMPWKPELVMLPAIAACLGKAGGGFLADRFGARRVGTASLLLSVPLLALSVLSPLAGALGLVAFNIVMPITLCALSDRLYGHPGLAFGTASMALIVGAFPMFFIEVPTEVAIPLLVALTIAAAAAIFVSVSDCDKSFSNLWTQPAAKPAPWQAALPPQQQPGCPPMLQDGQLTDSR